LSRNIHQLVLQFAVDTDDDFERGITLEDQLDALLAGTADVDGHDFGSGEMNIFILTPNPAATFERCLPAVTGSRLSLLGAAHREISTQSYQRIWPVGSSIPFVVA
jgi:hypothetical protein